MKRPERRSACALIMCGWLVGASLLLCTPVRAEAPAAAAKPDASASPARSPLQPGRATSDKASRRTAPPTARPTPAPPTAKRGPAPPAPTAGAATSPSSRGRPKRTPVNVPSTPHVRAEFPEGLQADLDADPRMQAWLDQTFAVIDQCHARGGRGRGTLEGALTMHESARPELALGSLPPALAPVVACASEALLRTRMPLFTGREGTRYPVRLIFQ